MQGLVFAGQNDALPVRKKYSAGRADAKIGDVTRDSIQRYIGADDTVEDAFLVDQRLDGSDVDVRSRDR